MDRNSPSPLASSPLASASDASSGFPIARLDVDRAEWKSKTIGRSFGSDARTPQDSTDSPASSTPSTPTTPLSASRTYHSLNYAPRQRNSVLRPSAAAIFQSHSAQLAAGAQPSQTPTSPSQPLPNLMLTPRANAHAAPLAATSHLSTSPSHPTISLPDAPPRESSRASNEHETQRAAVARMQLQQMHDNARRLGLNNKSAGWLILEALQAATEGEWAAVAELLANGDATILLPRDPPSVFTAASQLSASFAYDHTIFNAASTSAQRPSPALLGESAETPILTLSGLRGRLARSSSAGSAPSDADAELGSLSLQSFVVKAHGSLSSLKDANARQETLESLAPLPHATQPEPSGARCAYPRFTLAAANAAFPLPPPLQPRAVANDANAAAKSRARSNSKLNVAGSRASASFASIFGGSGRERRRQAAADEVAGSEMVDAQKLGGTSESDAEPEAHQSSLGLELRDAAAGSEVKHAEDAGGTGRAGRRTISVWVVDHLVRRSAVMRTIRKTLEARIRTRLAAAGVGESIAEVVARFAATFLPPVPTLGDAQGAAGGSDRSQGARSRASSPVPNASYLAEADEMSEAVQDLFSSVRDQLQAQDVATAEARLEVVETVLCEEVYDRIFRPVASRDGYHDDALASRIAALNVLGLSLRHLGLDDPAHADGLERIVQQCGAELQRLDSEQARSPKDKLDVLVRAHKLAVDGVAALSAAEGTSADLILPLLIYSIVAANPARLASHLLYIQRFRAECLVQGETAYCLVNVQAAVAFLENVDVADLGLDASQLGAHLLAGENARERRTSGQGAEEALAMPARIRGRLTQEIGDLAGVSNKVITGVMGSSLAAFSRMMGAAAGDAQRPANVRAASMATDYSRGEEQIKDSAASDEAKLSIGDRLASLSTRLGGSSLSSSPSSLSLGYGGKKEEGVSPRSVSRELPGPPPPSKPVHARTTSYLASQLGRMASRAPEEAKPVPASLRSPYPALSRPPTPDRPLHVVLASTGSVASVKMPLIVEALLAHANVRVQVIATDNSLHFYDRTPLTSAEYSVASLAAENLAASRGLHAPGPRVHLWTNADEWTSFTRVGDAILHIELRRWADVVLVAPCSANTLAKLAGGLCDDLLTSFMRALGRGAEVVLCPAMNTLMWENPLTEMHLRTVKEVLGYEVRGPVEKRLACGDTGKGAMMEWSEIVHLAVDRFGLQKEKGAEAVAGA